MENFTKNSGWQCPICLHVYAPSVAICADCPIKTTVITTGTNNKKNKISFPIPNNQSE